MTSIVTIITLNYNISISNSLHNHSTIHSRSQEVLSFSKSPLCYEPREPNYCLEVLFVAPTTDMPLLFRNG